MRQAQQQTANDGAYLYPCGWEVLQDRFWVLPVWLSNTQNRTSIRRLGFPAVTSGYPCEDYFGQDD